MSGARRLATLALLLAALGAAPATALAALDVAVQPTREQFVARRGQTSKPPSVRGFPGHHFNAVTSWAVDRKGEVRHVYA